MTVLIAMIFFSMASVNGTPDKQTSKENPELQVLCSPELEGLANQLVSDYLVENQDILIQVTATTDPDLYGTLGQGIIALMNKEDIKQQEVDNYFKLVLGRDAIVPIMNKNNPQKDLIGEQGISPEEFSRIYSGEGRMTWGEIFNTSDTRTIHALVPEGNAAQNYLADFLSSGKRSLNELALCETGLMIEQIANDPGAIGFCNLADLLELEKGEAGNNIELVPVDADGDNRIGAFEEIYASASGLSHAIYVGRFPAALYSKIYAVQSEQPAGAGEIAFLEWMLGSGQETLAKAGMLELGFGERTSRIEQLAGHEYAIADVPVEASPARIFLLVGGIIILLGFLAYAVARMSGRRRLTPAVDYPQGDDHSEFPAGFFFDRSHTWAFMEKNGQVRIGIDAFLQEVCGPVSRVATKQPGEHIRKGENFLTLIQNGKRLEIKSPVSGIVREQNDELLEDAGSLNHEPYSDGWVLMVEPQDWVPELKSFFMGQSYAEWLKKEGTRLKAFFTAVLKLETSAGPEPVLQDGGEIRAGILESFGPEIWEEFQVGFINKTK